MGPTRSFIFVSLVYSFYRGTLCERSTSRSKYLYDYPASFKPCQHFSSLHYSELTTDYYPISGYFQLWFFCLCRPFSQCFRHTAIAVDMLPNCSLLRNLSEFNFATSTEIDEICSSAQAFFFSWVLFKGLMQNVSDALIYILRRFPGLPFPWCLLYTRHFTIHFLALFEKYILYTVVITSFIYRGTCEHDCHLTRAVLF